MLAVAGRFLQHLTVTWQYSNRMGQVKRQICIAAEG
jgi:hypothetical protein